MVARGIGGANFQVMQRLNVLLEWCGNAVAQFWLPLASLIVIIGFPITGVVASFWVGVFAAWIVGYGVLGAVAFFVCGFLFALFLSIYVWEPHVKKVVFRAADDLRDRKSN
jgi:membrane protein implicated in regulation of membrane protease activity